MASASEIVKKPNVKPNPEGGLYSETSRDRSLFPHLNSPLDTKLIMKSAKRSTSCYHPEMSRPHCIPCAETWNFYLVEPITILELNKSDVQVKSTCLGPDLIGGNQWQQHTVLPNVRFGAFPAQDYISADGAVAKATAARHSESHYFLVSCTSAPLFSFRTLSWQAVLSSFHAFQSMSQSSLFLRCLIEDKHASFNVRGVLDLPWIFWPAFLLSLPAVWIQ